MAISPLHLDFRPGREPNRDGQEGTDGGGRGWASLPSYHVGGLWPEIIPTWLGALNQKAMKITSLCPSWAERHIAKATGEGHSLGSGRPSGSLHWRIQAAYPSHSGKASHLSLLWGFQKEVNLFLVLACPVLYRPDRLFHLNHLHAPENRRRKAK